MRTSFRFFIVALLSAVIGITGLPTENVWGKTNDNYLAASRIHHKYSAWNAAQEHLISGTTTSQCVSSCGYFGQACSSGFGTHARNAWVNYVGRDSRYQSSYTATDWKLTADGVQCGTDFVRTRKGQAGAVFGYEESTGTLSGDSLKGQDYYVGMYSTFVFSSGADLRTVFSYGWQNFDSQRRGTDHGIYRMVFKGNTTELNVDLGARRHFGRWSSRPSLAVDWYMSQLGGGQETAVGNDTLRYGKMEHSQLFFRFGTDLRYKCGPLTFDSGLFCSYDMLGDMLRSDVWTMRGGKEKLSGSQLGRSVVSYNLGGSWMVTHRFTVFGGYRGEYIPESAGGSYVHVGTIGSSVRW